MDDYEPRDLHRALFESAPSPLMLLDGQDLRIVAVNDAYLEATGQHRNRLLGRRVDEVFPGRAAAPPTGGAWRLGESLNRVRAEGVSDHLGVQRFRLPLAEGGFEERHWSIFNAPVVDDDGAVRWIVLRLEDVTDLMTELTEIDRAPTLERVRVLVRQLALAEDRVRQRERQLAIAERVGNMGSWELNLATGRLSWSDQVFRIFGVSPREFGHDLASLLAVVHPDDREAVLTAKARVEQGSDIVELNHRVVRRDGEVRHVHAVAERVEMPGGPVLAGTVRDVTALIRAQSRAERAGELLRLAGKVARLGAWAVDLADDHVYWSDEIAAIHEEAPGTSPTVEKGISYYAPEFREPIRRAFEECASAGTPYDLVAQIVTATGRKLWVRSIGEAQRDGHGNIVGVHGAFQDISELTAAEQRAHAAAERVRRTLDNLSDAFFVVDRDWRIVFMNRETGRMFDAVTDAVLGRVLWEAFPRLVETPFEPLLRETMTSSRHATLTELSPLSGRWFDVRVYPHDDGLAIYVRDVSAERAQQAQLRLLETAVSRLNDMVMITRDDAEGESRFVYVNDALLTGTGFAREEVIGRTPSLLLDPLSPAGSFDELKQAFASGAPARAELAFRVRPRAGARLENRSPMWVEVETVPISGDPGSSGHFVWVARDVTRQRELERQLRQAQRLDAVGQLTGGVAHDFNNLLTVILGSSEILLDLLADQPQLAAMAEVTRDAAVRGAELTNRLLAFARRQTLDPQPTDVERLLAGMHDLLRRTLGADILIEMVHGADLWPAMVDPGQLESAVLNLCINARDAMPQGGRLTVEVVNANLGEGAEGGGEASAGEYVMVAVTDTGTGMAPGVMQRAFEPFFTTKEVGKGSGLGLSMVYGFARQSAGHVHIRSEPGAGTTVRLYLPRAATSAPTQSPATDPTGMVGGTEHILLAEDDALVRGQVAAQLEALGYRVTAVADGRAAVACLADETFDLLITDVVMPGGMNGTDLAATARSLHPLLPVLFVSGYAEDAIVLGGRPDADIELLSKPFRRQDLAAKVRHCLDAPTRT